MNALVRYELADGIATLWMDDGKANVMSPAMLAALNEALDRAEREARVVVLHGRPDGAFCGGFDLATVQRGGAELLAMLEAGMRLCLRLVDYPLPVVAACTGHAVALGAILLLACDLRIGVDVGARLHISEVRMGMNLPHVTVALCRERLSPTHLHIATALGLPFTPADALKAGFLHALVPATAMAGAVRHRAADLASLPPAPFAVNKRRISAGLIQAMRAALQADQADWQAQGQGGSHPNPTA